MKFGDYNWFTAEVKFNVENNPIEFNVIHNMDEKDFINALESWQCRTNSFTDVSFCKYIERKSYITNHIAFTEKEYKQLSL